MVRPRRPSMTLDTTTWISRRTLAHASPRLPRHD
jgi:hypothetical protein